MNNTKSNRSITISDSGRGSITEIAIFEEGQEVRFVGYDESDHDEDGSFTKEFWKANGFSNCHLTVDDQESGVTYQLDID